ncbi:MULTISPECIES: ornithine carbamoyltransferase [unclassified Rhizobium]|uniref:ornithine carbamoyltransferase n=1 Tax=unclassified Rhizobium TaxID=2613769 RepID=UPI0007E9708E|nr:MULTISPECIES: ornithine carbamoyltransferase [unclassified Rhizobium]ANK91534.1 aspartate/ornithine carbamoyltransferase domain-containing protein [Rhizobium sp. N6212]ANK97567.1 aspartate/ornithine carbamoyltransferase domain-containing protein [Rhizobium sp. N621]
MNSNPNKDFLEFHSLPPDTIIQLIDRSAQLAKRWNSRTMPQSLSGKRIGIIVDDTGWRNTTAFDLGVKAMGGISAEPPISFNIRESTTDLAGYLDNWFDLLVIRTKEIATLRELASVADAPIINARTKSNHPCETLGDLAYINSVRGAVDGMKVVGIAPDANIFRSWVEASKTLPIHVVQVYPERWHVTDPNLLNPNFETSFDIRHVFDADVIVTDSWPGDAEEGELAAYRVSASLLDQGRQNTIFLPCPPVARGQEVTADAMSHPTCRSRSGKAFLLHAQNALMEWAIS